MIIQKNCAIFLFSKGVRLGYIREPPGRDRILKQDQGDQKMEFFLLSQANIAGSSKFHGSTASNKEYF